ncbi:extracellular solute-binding protein [Terrihabitans rhizophilus]|uniref:Extracellular solute-binding protein n=1 Tax=Terrihabitans rhizophilus TaxID=3092662 RepID=A0ABU4RNV7_9HYPH|nr:extracellular solute-binding protein [Terrihabitans sp. PJ23]MDX6805335.1 extracellular solute-binding protein [Terrihabitans sp. PJ23]
MPPNFAHLPYANPDAPVGGRLVQGVLGSFDSLNPFAVRGTVPAGIANAVVEPLMARSYDEPFTLYGLLAESVAVPEDRSFVEFRLNAAARFSDGRPVTAEDVVFSWQLLRDHGRPNHRTYYSKVVAAEVRDERTVRFDLSANADRELPLILGLLPVLAKHTIDPNAFETQGLRPLIGSGRYVISDVRPGTSFTLTRNPNYWGAALPVARGLGNFGELRYDFYRDANTMFDAFRKGQIDIRPEQDPARWLNAYGGSQTTGGQIEKEEFTSGAPRPIQAFVFNTRRPLFADIRVREALSTLFDFEWVNAGFFHGAYARTASFFEGSDLSARGRKADDAERALLAPFPDTVRGDVLEGVWQPSKTDGSGRDREQLRGALRLLEEAGWRLDGGTLRNKAGQPFRFELLVKSKDQERIALAYARDLARAGITADIRLADTVGFESRLLGYEFDMTVYTWDNSLSPGNEQAFYWGSSAADAPGTRNYMGAKQPAIDAMIAAIVKAGSRDDLVSATRALDRVLMSRFYVVPLYHLSKKWIARWDRIGHPATTPLYGPIPETWWREVGK